MAQPFHELRERLLRAGIAPRHVRRYVKELAEHLADLHAEEQRWGRTAAEAEAAALKRLGGIDELARAMTDRRDMQSWSARAPWATFGLGPLLLLVVVSLIWPSIRFLRSSDWLWVRYSGWLYLGAPVLIGWGVAVLAARQRSGAFWPLCSLASLAVLVSTAHVFVSPSWSIGRLSMRFILERPFHYVSFSFFEAAAILALTALPYLGWQLLRKVHRPLPRKWQEAERKSQSRLSAAVTAGIDFAFIPTSTHFPEPHPASAWGRIAVCL